MKRRLALLLAIVMVVGTMMMGCKSKSDLAGTTWVATSLEDAKGTKISGDNLKAIMDFTIEFKDDNKLHMAINGSETDGTYSQKGDKVTLTADDGSSLEVKVDGSTMTMEQNGSKVTFEKK